METLSAISGFLSKITMYVACFCLACLLSVVIYGVVLRYCFNDAPAYVEQLALILVISVAMFGAAAGVRDATHIGLDSFVNLFSKEKQLIFLVLVHVCSFSFAQFLLFGGWAMGLSYIAIYTLSSYFVSGWIKLLQPEWRSGQALTVFLNGGLYGPLPPNSLFRHPKVACASSWAFILWESAFPLVLIYPEWAVFFICVAAGFHFMVFWFFGLNRFFWAWLTNLTAVWFFCSWLKSFWG